MSETLTSIAILLALLSTSHLESDRQPWTSEDLAWQSVFTVLTVVDWGQTLWFRGEGGLELGGGTCPDGSRKESNPVFGDCPSRGRINLAISTAIVGHWLVSNHLPPPWRRVWQSVWIAVEVNAVNNNRKKHGGIRLGFSIAF